MSHKEEARGHSPDMGIPYEHNTHVTEMILSESIETLEGLSPYIKRLLMAGGVLTIKELVDKTKTALLQIPQIGGKRFAEIKKTLVSIGLWSEFQELLSMDIETLEGLSPRTRQILKNKAIYSVDDIINMITHRSGEFLQLDQKIQDEIINTLDSIGMGVEIQIDVEKIFEKVLHVKIEDVGILPTSVKKALKAEGIKTIADLRKKTKSELLQVPGIDEKVFSIIKEIFIEIELWSQLQERLPMDIETLEGLSPHTRQALKNKAIHSVGDILNMIIYKSEEFLQFDQKIQDEINEALDSIRVGVEIQIDVEEELRVKIEDVKIFSPHVKRNLKAMGVNTIADLSKKTKSELLQAGIDEKVFGIIKRNFVIVGVWSEFQELLSMDIETLEGLPPDIQHALKSEGIYDITNLNEKTDSELSKIPNIGKKGVATIRTCLDNFTE